MNTPPAELDLPVRLPDSQTGHGAASQMTRSGEPPIDPGDSRSSAAVRPLQQPPGAAHPRLPTLAEPQARAASVARAVPVQLATLQAGDRAHGFEVRSVYLDAAGRPVGARWRHEATHFQLDLLQGDWVPQAITWVMSIPPSSKGESHSHEHLLVGRGIRGRTLALTGQMSLVQSHAYTADWRTCYHFNASAGIDTFFAYYAEQQHALLRPDYSDLEIRLEVWNYGVERTGGALKLAEQGVVYSEMKRTMATGYGQAFRAWRHAVYGEQHALGRSAGGDPEEIRKTTPDDIRRFHAATHHQANMGTVAALPVSVPLDDLLPRFDRVLREAGTGQPPRPADTLESLPPFGGTPQDEPLLYEYAHDNPKEPSPVMLVWPAERKLDATDQLLAELFVDSFAGDAGTNLYRLLVDSRSRQLDAGGQGVSGWVGEWGGHPITVLLNDVDPGRMSKEHLFEVRRMVSGELQRIAGFADGSAELQQFNRRVTGHMARRQREAIKFLGTPPAFGRGFPTEWIDLLTKLEASQDEPKSLAMKPEFDRVRALLASGRNIWRDALARWRLTGVEPYVVGARPSPAELARERSQAKARSDEQMARLQALYRPAEGQELLRRYADQRKADLARLDRATQVSPGRFVDKPPMTLDDDLQFESIRLSAGVQLVASRLDSMTGAATGLAVRLDRVPRENLLYLSLMPELLTRAGVIDDGKPLSFADMSDRLRREVLALRASFIGNERTGRVELNLRGSGVGLEESSRALDWMAKALHAPDWRPENLPRLRDVVDQALAALRHTPQQPEADWVRHAANAWLMQRHPAWMASRSFLTRQHHALRLRWQLMDAGTSADRDAVAGFLTDLAQTGQQMRRPALEAALAVTGEPEDRQSAAVGWSGLSNAQRGIAEKALLDLRLSLDQMPDSSLGADFSQLTLTLRDDLALPVDVVLKRLEATRAFLLGAGGARMFLASPQGMRDALVPQIDAFAARLDAPTAEPAPAEAEPLISRRLRERGMQGSASHVGLHQPSMPGGVIISWAPGAHFTDFEDEDKLLDYLAATLYTGPGSHSAHVRTSAEGLGYSNGVVTNARQGHVGYYAERVGELSRIARFVVKMVREGQPAPALAEYVIAQAFEESRANLDYESRAAAIAADLADGQAPEQVRRFREALLALRDAPDLVDRLLARKDRVYAGILPGYDAEGRHPQGQSFVIGPDQQLDGWERYLQENAAAGTTFERLYGRDFWMT